MAGFTSFASTAMSALSLANTAVKGLNSYKENSGSRDYQETQQKNDAQLAGLKQQAALSKEEYRLQQERDEQERRIKLRQAMAEQRAKFGSQGIGSGDGSSQAVLYGLLSMSDEDRTNSNSTYALKKSILDQQVDQQQRINTLQLTQLKEKNKLSKVTSLYDSLTSIF